MRAHQELTPRPDWNPYVAGVALGLVLLFTYLVMGFGLGGSAAITRVSYALAHLVAPATVEASAYMRPYVTAGPPLEDWMVFEVLGVLLGGIVAAHSGRRLLARPELLRGPRSSVALRVGLALVGGILMGYAARLARGCTSGQALTGGAALAVGSWIFMFAVFAGGYLAAPLVRRMWR